MLSSIGTLSSGGDASAMMPSLHAVVVQPAASITMMQTNMRLPPVRTGEMSAIDKAATPEPVPADTTFHYKISSLPGVLPTAIAVRS